MKEHDRLRRRLVAVSLAALVFAAPGGTAWAAETTRRAVITVQGMACPFCAYGLEKRLRAVPGVAAVQVDLAASKATVEITPGAEVSEEALQRAVREAGFTPRRIE